MAEDQNPSPVRFRNGGAYGQAAVTVVKNTGDAAVRAGNGVASQAKKVRVAFADNTTKTKLGVITGVVSGVTLSLQGARNIKKGLTKDEDGNRDWGTAAIGAAEAGGGLFVAALFYERMKQPGPSAEKS